MSRHLAKELRDQLAEESRRRQRSIDALDEAAAATLGVNRTDLRCLDVLMEQGQATPGQLATEVGITTGSVTAMLRRLEALGYVQRETAEADRRSVIVTPTRAALDAAMKLYGPLAQEGATITSRYGAAELDTLLDYTRRDRLLQQRHAERIRSLPSHVARDASRRAAAKKRRKD